MAKDRITSLRIQGLRTLEDVSLSLEGLTVMIGENGSGKSSVLEACEVLRRATESQFLPEVDAVHGGLWSLLRHGARRLTLVARIEATGAEREPLEYELVIAREGQGTVIEREALHVAETPGQVGLNLILRGQDPSRTLVHSVPGSGAYAGSSRDTVLFALGAAPPNEGIRRMREALENIEVHVPFEVTPSWIARAHDRKSALRASTQIQAASRLSRLGSNLANAFHSLRSDFDEAQWQETMDYVRLGLGDRIETINARPSAEGGAVALWVKLRGRDDQIPASGLADGVLAFLAFIAMFRLGRARTLLAFDEPELHLHPRLLMRVLGFFETIAQQCPVILATHSDRLLDGLRDPTNVLLCELDEATSATRLLRPDATALQEWLADYRGLGDLRSAGYLDVVMTRTEPE